MAGLEKNTRLNFVLNLIDKVTQPLAKVEGAFTRLGDKGKKALLMTGIGFAGIMGSVMGLNQSLQPALALERALGEVKGYGVASEALGKLNAAALDFTASYGGSAESFVKSSLLIDKTLTNLTANQLAHVTTTSNLLAKTLKTDATTTSDYLSKVYGAYSEQANAIGRTKWLDTVASQSSAAVKIFKTSGTTLQKAFDDAGNKAARAGVKYSEQLAIYGTLSGQMKGEKVGSASKALFDNLGSAGGKLGLNFTDGNGQLLSTLEIVDKLNNKFGDLSKIKNSNALKTAFGGEGAEAMMILMKNVDKLRGGMDKLGNIHGLEQLKKMADDLTDPWERFSGAVNSLRVAFGQALIPILAPLMEQLAGMAKTLVRWTTLFPNITKLIGMMALAFLGLTLITSTATFVFGVLKTAFIGLSIISRITGLTWLFNAALAANPIGLIIIGIVALGAAIAWAIYDFDSFISAMKKVAGFILNAISPAFMLFKKLLDPISDWFNSVGGWSGVLKAAIRGYLSLMFGFVNKMIDYINMIPGVNLGKLSVDDIDFLKNDQVPTTFAKTINNGDGSILQAVKNENLLQNNARTNYIEKIEINTEKAPDTAELLYNLTIG